MYLPEWKANTCLFSLSIYDNGVNKMIIHLFNTNGILMSDQEKLLYSS